MAAVPIMTEPEAMEVFRIAPPQHPSQDLIALRDLVIDPRYQRDVSASDVRKIARAFDELAFGVVYVSERIDRYTGTATYAVIDGQHRVAAARLVRDGDWRVPVFVYQKLTPEQEAALFVVMNSRRRAVFPVRQFKAELFAGMPEAVAINDIVTSVGLRVSVNGEAAPDNIHAVAALRTVYRTNPQRTLRSARSNRVPMYADGGEVLRAVLQILSAAWYPSEGVYTAEAIRGLARFLTHYGELIDRERLVYVMRRDGFHLIRQRTRALREINRETADRTFARVLVASYNHGRKKDRLPDMGGEVATADEA